ncbi:MAG: adenine deaminase [Bacteroidales bacterium]|nr:adenine deaminase [Bacteroidales bacterium]
MINRFKTSRVIKVNYVNVISRSISTAEIKFGDTIEEINVLKKEPTDGLPYCTPGLIDAHVHIESSMLSPQRFAEMVIPHGSVGVVCDPHEIANVLGEDGVRFMIDDAHKSPLNFYFCIPSCVPSTPFETNGAVFGPIQVRNLVDECVALAEVMNYPGVVNADPKMMEEIAIAQEAHIPVDGHAPGLMGEDLKKYVAAGVSTDHECYSLSEAKEKIALGMKVLIREGSAARNLDALQSLLKSNPYNVMACTDDAHPDDIRERGHIDKFFLRALEMGISIFDIFQILSVNPVSHYKLDCGLVQVGDKSNFLLLNSLKEFSLRSVILNGQEAYNSVQGLAYDYLPNPLKPNNFVDRSFTDADFQLVAPSNDPKLRVIVQLKDQIVTQSLVWQSKAKAQAEVKSDIDNDIVKIAVVNRYDAQAPVVNGFIKGTGLKSGAMASSIAHDSHNVVIIGADAQSMRLAAEAIFASKGGIVVVNDNAVAGQLELPIAGLMTNDNFNVVADKYQWLIRTAQEKLGVDLSSPFMSMAFMSLLVIPSLKIGDKCLFDVDTFSPVDVFVK